MRTLSHKFSFICTLLVLLCALQSEAQVNSILGRFTVDFDRGCAGMTVNITQNGTFTTPQYWYEGFDQNVTGDQANLTYTYNEAGDFYITLVVNDNDLPEGQSDSLLVSVTSPEIPEFTLHNCDGNNVRVEITQDYYDSYQVDFTATDGELVNPLSFSNAHNYGTQGTYRIDVTGVIDNGANDFCGTANQAINTITQIETPMITSVETLDNSTSGAIQVLHTLGDDIIYTLNTSTRNSTDFTLDKQVTGPETNVGSVNTNSDFFCYQIETYDACNEVIIPSNIVCSVLFDVKSSEQGNLITWETDSTQVRSYNILTSGNLLVNLTPNNLTSYVDTAVICKKEYIYNVQPLFTGGSSLAIDTAVLANQSGDLPAITKYPSSSVNYHNNVVLDWGPPDTGEIPFRKYLIEKNINNRGWLSAGSTEDTTYTDQNASFVGSHAYRISYDDECGNIASGSPSTAPIIVKQTSSRGRVVTYEWNKYATWLQGIRGYTIERVDTAGNVLEEYPVLSGRDKEIEFDPNDLVNKYMRVRAESLDDTPQFTYSNVVLTQLSTEMYLPTAFTPDGDGLNDTFYAKGPSILNFYMEVYNRWGILVFGTTDNLNGWDGMIRGEDAPEGTYIYKIYFEDGEGRDYSQSGAFTLLRQR